MNTEIENPAADALGELGADLERRSAAKGRAKRRYVAILNGEPEIDPGELQIVLLTLAPTPGEILIHANAIARGSNGELEPWNAFSLSADIQAVRDMKKLTGEMAAIRAEQRQLAEAEAAAAASDQQHEQARAERAMRNPNISSRPPELSEERRAARMRMNSLHRDAEDLRDKIHKHWAKHQQRAFFGVGMPLI